jgi:[acyl-carrier-protein] S-malonyltransferase
MGKAVYEALPEAREVFEQADARLPMSITELCFNSDDESLRLTQNTQPAILTVSAALHRVLEGRNLKPDWVAGHSLGEYSALVAAGVLDVGSAAELVHNRGRYMQEAVAEGAGSMAAILGLDNEEVAAICASQGGEGVVEVANLNAPGQVVIAGHQGAVQRAVEAAKEAGARRAILLNVSAPFHCSLMQPAADRLAPELADAAFAEPAMPVVCNVDAAAISGGDAARDALRRQVTSPVRWSETLEFLAAQGVDVFVEVGPGRVLSSLVKRTLGRGVGIYAVDELEEIDAVVQALD